MFSSKFLSWLPNDDCYTGKPIAVTHSRGKSAAPRSGTNVEYEKRHWMQKKTQKTDKKSLVDDQELSEGECEETETSCSTDVSTTLYSMAEIASCSYEARKVSFEYLNF